MSKLLSKKEEFENLRKDCENIIKKNVSKFNSLLDNLKEKIAFLENVKKNVVENNVFEVQKRLGILGEAKDLNFNQNKIESIIVDSIKLNTDLKKETYHSGLFRGLFYGLLLSIISFFGILFYFIQKNSIEITHDLFIDPVKYNHLFEIMSYGQDPLFSKIALGLISLFIIFVSVFFSQLSESNKNLDKINRYRENIGEFELQIGDKSILINNLNNHLDKYIKALKIYGALLSEKEGKLDRIIFFEKHNEIKGTNKPMGEIFKIQEMLSNLDTLISTDILTDEGLISVDSIDALNNSVDYLNIYIKELYA